RVFCLLPHRSQPKGIRRRSSHGDGVRVLESERRQPANAVARSELRRDALKRGSGAGGGCFGQDRGQSRARVLRVDVDRITAQRGEGELGGPEARPTIDAHTARLEELGEQLGEYIRL